MGRGEAAGGSGPRGRGEEAEGGGRENDVRPEKDPHGGSREGLGQGKRIAWGRSTAKGERSPQKSDEEGFAEEKCLGVTRIKNNQMYGVDLALGARVTAREG